MQLDTLYTINTPEGIALQLAPAGFVPRFLAWVVDFLIRIMIFFILIAVLGMLGKMGTGIALIVIFILEWWYPIWFEWRHNGQTPGKRLFQLYTVQRDGSPIHLSASMLRNLLRFVDFLPFMYGFGVVSMLFSAKFQRLGDWAADTVVLYKPKLSPPLHLPQLSPLPLPVPLLASEQQTLLQFAERYRTLTQARAEELAQVAGSVLVTEAPAATQLQRYALWIAGQTATGTQA